MIFNGLLHWAQSSFIHGLGNSLRYHLGASGWRGMMTAWRFCMDEGTGRRVHDMMQSRSNQDTMSRQPLYLVERTRYRGVEPKGAAPVITHPLGAIDVAQQADDHIPLSLVRSLSVPLSWLLSPPRLQHVRLFGSVPLSRISVALPPGRFS
jgi:hypothetical protein